MFPVILCAVKRQSIHTYERATKDVSAESSAATDVIPLVIGIKRARSQLTNDTGLQTMKKEIINDMNTRFADVAWQTFQSFGVRDCQAVASAVHCRIQLQRVQLQ